MFEEERRQPARRLVLFGRDAPKPITEVVKLADLERVLGPGEARLDGAGRAKQIDDRRAHLRWRFRT